MAVRWVNLESLGRHGLRLGRHAPGPWGLELGGEEEDEVMKRTTLCLTTPYDRALVACVEGVGNIVGCYRAFEARHGPVPASPE